MLGLKTVAKEAFWPAVEARDPADLAASSWPTLQSTWAEPPWMEVPSEASWALERGPLLHQAEHLAGAIPLAGVWLERRVWPLRT